MTASRSLFCTRLRKRHQLLARDEITVACFTFERFFLRFLDLSPLELEERRVTTRNDWGGDITADTADAVAAGVHVLSK